MEILGINNQKVELRIANYQFPDTEDRSYDGNWLNIYLMVDCERGKWQTITPCLLTWEVEELCNWFITLSNNLEPEYKYLEFIEPNLSFELMNVQTDELKHIKIHIRLEGRPKTAREDEEYFVIFEADSEYLMELAKDLTSELANFPMRD